MPSPNLIAILSLTPPASAPCADCGSHHQQPCGLHLIYPRPARTCPRFCRTAANRLARCLNEARLAAEAQAERLKTQLAGVRATVKALLRAMREEHSRSSALRREASAAAALRKEAEKKESAVLLAELKLEAKQLREAREREAAAEQAQQVQRKALQQQAKQGWRRKQWVVEPVEKLILPCLPSPAPTHGEDEDGDVFFDALDMGV